MKKIFYYTIILLLLFASCKKKNVTQNKNHDDKEIVRVFDKVLYESELKNLVRPGMSSEDSATIVQTYINSWVQNQVLLHFAEQYVQDEQAEIDKKVEDFRQSLVVNMFKKKIVNANSDSLVNDDIISQYYEIHKEEFKLDKPAFKGFFAKIPLDKANKDLIAGLKTSEQADVDYLMKEISVAGGTFDNFNGNWIYLDVAIQRLPNTLDGKNFCINKFVERQDDEYFYCIRILECKNAGDYIPIEMVKDKIKNIIITQKSEEIVDKFINNKYDSALKDNKIVFYK